MVDYKERELQNDLWKVVISSSLLKEGTPYSLAYIEIIKWTENDE